MEMPEDVKNEVVAGSATDKFIRDLMTRTEIAEKNYHGFKDGYVGDQARIVNMQSLLMEVQERWWPIIHKNRSFTSDTTHNLIKKFTPLINHNQNEAILFIESKAIQATSGTFPSVIRKMWSSGEVKHHLDRVSKVKMKKAMDSINERLKDVPF